MTSDQLYLRNLISQRKELATLISNDTAIYLKRQCEWQNELDEVDEKIEKIIKGE